MPSPSENAATVSLDEAPVFGSFVSGVVLTFGTRLLMLAGVFGSGVIVARWLGREGFGTYAVLNVTVALAVQVGSAGLPSANTFFLARDRAMLGSIFANALIFALGIGSILTVAVLGLHWLKPSLFGAVSARLLTAAAVSIPFQLLILLGLNILLPIDRIRQLNLFDALLPAWVLANALVVLIVLRESLFTLVSANTVAALILSLLLALYIGREVSKEKQSRRVQPYEKFQSGFSAPSPQAERGVGGEVTGAKTPPPSPPRLWGGDKATSQIDLEAKPTRVDLQLLRVMLRYGVKFYISIVAGAIIFRVDVLIVNRFRGADEAGVYAVASQFSFLLLMLPGVIATLLFPRVAASRDERGEFAAQVTRHTTLLMLLTCGAAAAVSFVLPWIYGARFSDATVQLLILLPGIFLMGLESVLVQHFTGTGLPAIIPVFWIITVVFNLGLNLMVVPAFGARGAAATSTLSYALIFLLVAIYFCMKTGRRPAETFLLQPNELRNLFTPRRWLRGTNFSL